MKVNFMNQTWSIPMFNTEGGAGGGGQATVIPGAAGAEQPVVIDGVTYTPDQLKELVSKGKDYTKKTQELSRKTQEFESQRQKLEHLSEYENFISRLETDPNLSQQVISVVQAYSGQQAPTQTQINTIKQAAEKTDDSDTRAMLEDMQLDMEIAKLQTKFPDFDESAVLDYAERENIPDLEKAYKLLNYDKHQSEAGKKALEDARKGAQVPRTQSGTAGSPPGTEVKKAKTWGEANAIAFEYMQGNRG